MALSEKDKKQVTGLVAFLAIAAAGLFIYFIHMPNSAKIATVRRQIDSLSVQVDSARRDLARGLRRRQFGRPLRREDGLPLPGPRDGLRLGQEGCRDCW